MTKHVTAARAAGAPPAVPRAEILGFRHVAPALELVDADWLAACTATVAADQAPHSARGRTNRALR